MATAMTPEDAEVASWPPVPPYMAPVRRQPALRIPNAQSVSQRIGRMQVTDPVNPEALGAKDAMKQLRIERARQNWERRFGRPHPDGQSMASQGQYGNIQSLLQRIELARQMNYR